MAVVNNKSNQSVELCKLIASIFVVFIHVLFPGDFGKVMDCLARFAVPLFLAFSGYYSYGTDCKRLAKRMRRLFWLSLGSMLIYFIWGCWNTSQFGDGDVLSYIENIFSPKIVFKWLFFNQVPFSGHLWYLTAILLCYGALWIYVRFFGDRPVNYAPLYCISFLLFIFQIVLGVIMLMNGSNVHFLTYRHTLFFALPMVSMGLFLREYQEKIWVNYSLTTKKLIAIILIGALLSLLQWFGIGKVEMPIATLFVVIALLLLTTAHPTLCPTKSGTVWKVIGMLSLQMYIWHPLLDKICVRYMDKVAIFAWAKEQIYLYPLFIVCTTVILAIVLMVLQWFIRILFRRTER